jgi:hypothetical protein
MRKRHSIGTSVLVMGFTLLLAAGALAGSKDTSLDELKARIPSAKPDDQVQICLTIAERQLASANELFRQNKPDDAQAAVREVVTYSGQARDAAGVTGHRLKSAEIDVRKMTHKLYDIKRSVPAEDQPPLQAAIEQLEKIDTDLLNKMFKGSK